MMCRAGARRWLAVGLLLLLVVACGPGTAPAAPAPAPAATVGAAPAAVPTTAAPSPIRLRVNWAAAGTGQTGIWASYEGGFGREQGLDLELTNVPNTARALQAAMQGDLDLTMVEPATAIQISVSGADTVLLLGAVNRLTYSVMAQPWVHDPQDLRGKTLGITRIGSATHSAGRVALKGWGLLPDHDVALRQLGENAAIYAALEAGQIDAAMLSIPYNIRARRAGYLELLDLGTSGPDYVSLAVGGLRGWVAANSEAVRRYARAYAQGLHRFKTDRAFALELYRKYLRLEDEQLLAEMYDLVRDILPSVPYVSEEGLTRLLQDVAVEDPRLVGRPATDWLEPRFVRELEASGFLRQLWSE
jgi:NitT/TauT family transport system substrate-binding protein